MPKYNEGSSPDPKYIKSLENSYNAKFKSTNRTGVSYSKVRNQLEINIKLPSSAGAVQFDANGKIPDPWCDNSPHRQSVTENPKSARQSKSYSFYKNAGEFTKASYGNYQDLVKRAKASVLGSGSEKLNAKTSSKTSIIEPPGAKPQPAVPGAGVASGIATLGIGYLVDRYVSPYLMDVARRGGGILSAELSYKLGNISEAELAEALRFIRDGNAGKWGERINEIRRIQNLAKQGIRSRVIESEQLPFTGGQGDGIVYDIVLENSRGETETKKVFGPVRGAINNFKVAPLGYWSFK